MHPSFHLSDYVPVPGPQRNFVRDSAWRSLQQSWPYCDVPRNMLLARLTREMAVIGTTTKIITPVDEPDDYVGWVSVRPQTNVVVMAFIKSRFRRWGIATMALKELGMDLGRTIGVVFVTPTTIDIGEHHYGTLLRWAAGFDHGRER